MKLKTRVVIMKNEQFVVVTYHFTSFKAMSQSLLDLCIGGWVGCYGHQPYKNGIALNATAEVDVTLPYLTLPYLKLVNTIPKLLFITLE